MLVSTLIPHAYSSTLALTVFTTKPSYLITDDITVYGILTYNDSPVPNWPVAIEVQDPLGTPVVTRTAQTNTNGTYAVTFKLPTNAKLGTYTAYVSSGYKGDSATNNTKFKLIQITQTTVTVEGKDYTITIESNATITNVTATKTNLNFTSSGHTGEKAYINITSPVGLNKTEIKVFIDNTELIPPPYPVITTNGTHYFIYFEFALSTHTITIQYAIADIATTNVSTSKTVVGQGYNVSLSVTVENQGDYTETFNLTVYANETIIETKEVTLSSGNSTTVTFTWNTTGFAKGNYTISAYAWSVEGETDFDDNNCTDGWVTVTWLGDLDGDCDVDEDDLWHFCGAFIDYYKIHVLDAKCDFDNNSKIDEDDLWTFCGAFIDYWKAH
jgi:hypothetical protein